MPFTKTYTALETGASKYLSLTNHMYTPQAVIASKKLWDKLSEDERKILQEAMTDPCSLIPVSGEGALIGGFNRQCIENAFQVKGSGTISS